MNYANFPGFCKFWKAWPQSHRKHSKGKCLARWKKDRLESKTAHVIASVESDAANLWDGNGQFVPAPLVWLNQQRWDREIVEAAEKVDDIATRARKLREKETTNAS